MESIIGGKSVSERWLAWWTRVGEQEIAWWTRVGELGTEVGLREIGCSEETIADTLNHLGAAEEFTVSEGLSKEALAVVCATVGRGISSGVKKFKTCYKPSHDLHIDDLKVLTALYVNLRSNINIKEVGLSGNIGTHPGFTLLATVLKSNSAIQTLDLSYCKIGTEGARCLMEGLKSNNTVTELNLSGNLLRDEGIRAIAEFRTTIVSLQTLDLFGCGMTSAGARCLMEALKSNNTIRSLNLGHNWLQNEGIEVVAEFLTTNVSLQSLNLDLNSSGRDSTTGATRLGSALERNLTLEHLSLRDNYFSSDDMKRLFQSLSREVGNEASSSEDPMNTTLKHLDLFQTPAYPMNDPTEDPLQAELIASMIRTNKSLAYLDLGGRALSSTDWKGQIFAALKENNTLEELGLRDCRGISEDVGDDLVILLRFFATGLRKIDLSYSGIKHRQGQVDEEIRLNTQYRRQLRGQIQVQTTSGRLVLCGYEFAGKTAICKTMKRIEHGTSWSHLLNKGPRKVIEAVPGLKKFLFGRDAYKKLSKRTRGFDVLVLRKQKYLASVWDFAGQREYYALHDYLFPNLGNSCFLYVCSCRCSPDSQNPQGKVKDDSSMRNEFEYWMRFIASNSKPRQGGDSFDTQLPHVRFVLTHKDTFDFDSLIISKQYAEEVVHELRHKFQDVLAIYQTVEVVNAHSLVDVEHLMKLTNDTLKEILQHQTEYAVCTAVRNAMERWSAKNPSKPVLSLPGFGKLCRNEVWPSAQIPFKNAQLYSVEGQKVVLNYLDDIGDLIFPKGLNFIVTNPRWFGVGVLGSLINALDQPRVSMFSGVLVRPKRLWKMHHKEGVVERRNIERLLQHSLQTTKLQQVLPSGILIKLMIHLELCFEVEPGNVDSSLFVPALFDDETEAAAKGKRQVQWKLERSKPLHYFGRRLECENKSITFLTPGFFPRLQVYLRNYIHEKTWTQNAGFEVGRNLICFAENGVEVIVEYSGDIDYFVDILIRSSKPYAVALQFVEEHVMKKIVQFCASPQGCQGVLLVEAVIRPVCVKELYLCADRKAHSVLSSILKARVVEDDGYEHIWSSKIMNVKDMDLAHDLLEGEGSYGRVIMARQHNLLGETSGSNMFRSSSNDEWLYSERGQLRKHLYPPMEDIASNSATNSIPRPKKINDSIYIFHETPNPKVEVLFFHDLNWRQYEQPHIQSWMSSGMPSVCWPVDWLFAKYPEAQILLANYDAGPWKTNTDGHMRLHTIAENFQHDILSIYAKDCPLVLVGHGLGGLVIKELVRSLQRERDELERHLHAHQHSADKKDLVKLDSLLRNVRGVLFFAPPFLGSGLIDYTKSNLRGSLLKYMEVMDIHAAKLNEWFRKWRQDRPQDSRCKVTTIFAALPTKVDLPTEVAVWCRHLTTYIVKEGSARFDSDTFYTSGADHFSVCKLHDETDSSFRMLTELIGPII